MISSYRRVFAHRGTRLMWGTGIIARLPLSMMTLGIVLLVSALHGSYALAGQISAAYVIGNAAAALPHGRMADRFGQARVLSVDAVVFGFTTGLLVLSISRDWATPAPHVLAALAGASLPQIGAMVRARWSALVDDPVKLHTAYAAESVADEVVFVVGPALVTFLSTLAAPELGLLVTLAVGTLGPLALAAQRDTQPPVTPRAHRAGVPRMPWGRLVPLAVVATCMGGMFGAMEVATVAFAEDAGSKAASGAILAVLSVGSLLAGVVAGGRVWRLSLPRRLRGGVGLLTVGFVGVPLVTGLWMLGGAMFATGMAIAPTLIALFSLVQEHTPGGRLTEAMGLISTGISAGLAPGTYFAGVVADAHGGANAFWVCTVAAALALAATWACGDAPPDGHSAARPSTIPA